MIKPLHEYEDIEDYIDFIKDQEIEGRPLAERIAEVQYLYLRENQPWIVAFSGGKDSHALLTLVYFAILGLSPEQRTNKVYVVFCDTLAEAPPYLQKAMRVINAIQKQTEMLGLPIETKVIKPRPEDTFWSRLLGRGYPAPNLRTNRWCTDKIKLQPFRDFVKNFFQEGEDPIVVIGSRSEESTNREQIIAKYHSDDSYFDASDPNYRRYAPIKDWTVQNVWQVLGQHIKPGQYEFLGAWGSPWGTSNIALVELYDSTNSTSGECPLVESSATPGCGKSRFGCWSCTVVTKDKAIDGLILNGEKWLEPLAEFRNFLHTTTEPAVKALYRNDRRRDGYVTPRTGLTTLESQKDKFDKGISFVQGPYYMHFRKEWLKQLLEMEKNAIDQGYDVSLISVEELNEIRYQWRKDPLEPDWKDELPQIYNDVYGEGKINWLYDDDDSFGELEEQIIAKIAPNHNVHPELVKKLIELEISTSGLNKRKGIFTKIERVLRQDWGTIDEAKEKREIEKSSSLEYKQELEDIESRLAEIDAMLEQEM